MFLGIDLGTSEVKVILMDEAGRHVAGASASVPISRPRPRWSEQDPDAWWDATRKAVAALRRDHPVALSGVRAIGLSGQMHGATLLDRSGEVLRPAILWNDARSDIECRELSERAPSIIATTGNLVMAGFTAPKLLWVAKHEPRVFEQVATVLLPKDYLRFRLTGEKLSEMSDSSGTLWLDTGARGWSSELLAVMGLSPAQMPGLREGSEPAGYLRRSIADEWGIPHPVVIAGGGGDNAASAVGIGAVSSGDGFVSLGTSGVLFVVTDRFSPKPHSAMHTFCHALPGRWSQMSVMLSAASCLRWATLLCGLSSEADFLRKIAAAGPDVVHRAPLFLPYLSGERTPHDDPYAQGVFFGLTHDTDQAALGYAVLEGVAFGIADGLLAIESAGTSPASLALVGGGARSDYWAQLLANVLNLSITTHAAGEAGAATGAARLARMALGDNEWEVCERPPLIREYHPEPGRIPVLRERLQRFRAVYPTLKPLYRLFANTEEARGNIGETIA